MKEAVRLEEIGVGGGNAESVRAMFDSIAPRYEMLNRVLSFGLDGYWRRRTISAVSRAGGRVVLDLACGTGAMTQSLLKRSKGCDRIYAVDPSSEMLVRARAKRYLKEVGEKVVFIEASAEELPLASESIDTVMVAYGVRNFSDRQKALREMYRVLRPGGRLFVLEFSTPHGFMFKGLYRFYFRRWVPIVGGVVSKSRSAYEYLPRSVYAFPEGEAFLQELKEAGFASEFERRMTGGVVTLYASAKPLKPMQC